MTKKKMPLYVKILIGMALGAVAGLLAVKMGWDKFTFNWIKPWGAIFLNLLKLIAVPLIFVSLVKGISSLSNISKLSRIGFKTISLYVLSTVIAVSSGLILVNTIQPGNTFPEDKKIELQEKFNSTVDLKKDQAAKVKEETPLQFFVDMVPSNFFMAASDNTKMLQIIFFAILFGIAMVLLEEKQIVVVRDFFNGIDAIILKIIDLIMAFAPYGVFALIAGLIVDFSGDIDLFAALGLYAITVIIGLLVMIFIIYPLFLRLFTPVSYRDFYKKISPAQLLAFSTSSSAATLPLTLDRVENHLGVANEVASFVLPVGVTINMDGTSCYQAIAAVFIAQVFGVPLDIYDQLLIVLTATLASIGTPGIPGGSIVMLIIVLSSVGIPVEGLALILGIDRPLDMLRTVVNVTGDATVATIVAQSEGKLNYEPGLIPQAVEIKK
ncbi:dicarboxylate/amino acid:cation symporter [Ancylomarina euxinus]|uniref:Dicarboxylate/amino acid:cation symporter n=1 Tax=Ancylomarina euxinus TaxID=2283627 RepID=A0A425Y3W4_9BACT|nr:dicarboxylate/amino acid:cation symporter [Ancylomarina euxinus]MCZ4694553.1 dicarboxylate/amino acid:cation symporter [Ancylomarina euxinus]MUP14096.1 cation:dicarboxylase symporter family transporter [Ancylomarina euxinus]RRG22954.1 dicarboxylate/amino acid:cation symporter [Ancylomarina euxinus]